MIWFVFGAMLLTAVAVVAWPLYSRRKRFTPGLIAAVGSVVFLSMAMYWRIGTPVAPTARESADAERRWLEQRVANDPADIDGWRMLGQSSLALGDYARAIPALERAVELESASNPETLVDLGEAVLNDNEQSITGRAGELFERAVTLSPENPRALFYSGVAAIARDEQSLAADRWESLLSKSPPPEIEAMIRQHIAQWRGTELATRGNTQPDPANVEKPVVEVNVSLSDDAAADVLPDAPVFIVARDPAQPSPPIAVLRLAAGELPLSAALGDGDAMMPGRLPSAFERLQIVARTSASGNAIAQSGDWYGEATIITSQKGAVDIVLERQVP